VRAFAVALSLLVSAPALSQEAGGSVRLLALDVEDRGGVSASDVELVRSLVTNALRGRDNLVVATNADVRRRAPMEADRLGGCEGELCLYEMAQALDADWVMYGKMSGNDAGALVVELGVFDRKRGEIVDRQTIEGESAQLAAPYITAAMERLLGPVLAAATPSPFESPLFLVSASVTAVGVLVLAGAGGWALELESNLQNPDRHRDEKARSLREGPIALGATAAGAAITLLGAGLLTFTFLTAE
jgi:hypothetical protein